MHMPAKPDTLHGGQINPQPRNRVGAGGEPIARVLFDPAIVGARHLQGCHAFRDDVFGVVHQQGFQPRGAQIKPQKHGFPLCQHLCGVARLAHDDHAQDVILGHVADLFGADQRAVLHHRHTVAQLKHLAGVVADQEDAKPLGL